MPTCGTQNFVVPWSGTKSLTAALFKGSLHPPPAAGAFEPVNSRAAVPQLHSFDFHMKHEKRQTPGGICINCHVLMITDLFYIKHLTNIYEL